MKHKTAELEGERLNQAVANANAEAAGVVSYADYSGMWEYGGPIIEQEEIHLIPPDRGCAFPVWRGHLSTEDDAWGADGPTPLIAAMRAFVASKLGEEVDLP